MGTLRTAKPPGFNSLESPRMALSRLTSTCSSTSEHETNSNELFAIVGISLMSRCGKPSKKVFV